MMMVKRFPAQSLHFLLTGRTSALPLLLALRKPATFSEKNLQALTHMISSLDDALLCAPHRALV